MNSFLIKFELDGQERIAQINCSKEEAQQIIVEYNKEYQNGEYVDSFSNGWLMKKGYENEFWLPTVHEITV